MKTTPEALAEAYRKGTEPVGADRDDCPTSDDLGSLAAGRIGADQRRRVAEHVATCSACAAELRLAIGLQPNATRVATESNVRRFPRLRGRWLAAAATIVVAIGLGAVAVRVGDAPGERSALRGSDAATAAVVPADGAVLNSPPEVLRWRSANPGWSWRTTIVDHEGSPVWTAPRVADGVIAVPDDIRARLARGGTFHWRADGVRGVETATTELYTFVVAP